MIRIVRTFVHAYKKSKAKSPQPVLQAMNETSAQYYPIFSISSNCRLYDLFYLFLFGVILYPYRYITFQLTMPRQYKRKLGARRYVDYSLETLNKAIEAVNSGQKVKPVAQRFSIP